ncbi:MAG: DUF4912 domain-containing protein [Aulosira sp. DedQUE10]|nr:DUF4912 domain-containing protein [Aulosira sp. DedQUE10]
MRQQEKKDSAIVRLALLLAIGTAPMTATLLVPTPILAQSATDAPAFPLPKTLENGTTVRIDGSSSLSVINQNLKQSFEKQYSGTKVEVAANGTDAALKALLEGKIDLAALGRGLTPQEQAQGLEQVRLYREKIAIIVGAENPFKGSLTGREFARIFRGRSITDWSQVGGAKGKIRVIDRPATSDTRENLRSYPVFKAADFTTGANATQVTEDNTAEIAKQLGKDGISYALANQVTQLPGVRALKVHQTSPTDAKYPFSQPLVYVYKKSPSAATAGFLGFAIAPPGKQAIEAARTAEAAAIAQGGLQALPATTTTTTSPTTEATTTATASPTTAATTAVTASPSTEAITNTTDASGTTAPSAPLGTSAENNNTSVQKEAPFLLLLPLLAIAVLAGLSYWWFFKRRSSAEDTAGKDLESTPTATPLPVNPNEPAPEATNPALSAGAGAALSSEDMRNNGEFAWDTEAPAAVVNTSYPNLADVSTVGSQQELPKAPVSSATSDSGIGHGTEQPQSESNIGDNISTAGATTLAGGAALAAGVAGWSVVGGKEGDTEDTNTTIQSSNYTIWDTPASDEVVSELEQPIIETTDTIPDSPNVPEPTSDVGLPIIETAAALPDLPDLGEPTSDVELPIIETAATLPDLPDLGEPTSDVELPLIETAAKLPDLPNVGEPTSDVELPIIETAAALPDFPDFPEVDLNAIADEAESTGEGTEEEIIEIVSNLPAQTTEAAQSLPTDDSLTNLGAVAGGAVAAGTGIGAWSKIYGSEESAESNTLTPTTDHNAPVTETNFEDKVSLTLLNSESAHVSWQISDVTQQILQNSSSPLAFRLYDVTGIDLSYQNPELIQQYQCQAGTHETVVVIPRGDRNYIAEIGYVTQGDRWVLIDRSEVVRVFSPPHTVEDKVSLTAVNSESAYAGWAISDVTQQILQNSGSQLVLRLYDVTGIDLSYQNPELIQQYQCQAGTHETVVVIPRGDRNYIAEIGYVTQGDRWVLIDRSEIVRVFSNYSIVEDETDRNVADKVSLTPLNSEIAHVLWQISQVTQEILQNYGYKLALRFYDVTGIDLSYQTPHLLQEYECPDGTNETVVAIPKGDRNYIAEIGYVTAGGWVLIDRSEIVRVFSPHITETEPITNVEDKVNLTPQNSESAHVSWQISDKTQQILHNSASQLALRLYDVTGIDLSYQTPQLIQQYECPDGTQETVVAIPKGDRNYIAEIGYVTQGDRWVLIDRSEVVRVFSPPQTVEDTATVEQADANHESSIILTPRTPKWAYISWYISDHDKQVLHNAGISQFIIRLYDVTDIDLSYQTPHLVQQYECEELIHDRFVAIPNSDRDYITEIGYIAEGDRWELINRSSTVRIFSRPHPDFWFVADAELIIHGASEPDATVTIAGHSIKLKPDGTFHLRIPFSDSLMDYLMTANSANGEQTQTIHKKFSQENPEA